MPSPQQSPTHHPCRTTILLIVMHAGSVLGKKNFPFICKFKKKCTILKFKNFNFSAVKNLEKIFKSIELLAEQTGIPHKKFVSID